MGFMIGNAALVGNLHLRRQPLDQTTTMPVVHQPLGLKMMDQQQQQHLYQEVISSTSASGPAAATSFEPQVNSPALFSFLVIAFVFSLLQLRINGIRDAAIRREEALGKLRQVKAAELGGDISIKSEEIRMALRMYESSLKEELELRTVIPGVRIVAPNDPQKKEEDVAAAKQFLGLNLNEDIFVVENDKVLVGNFDDDESKTESTSEFLKRATATASDNSRNEGISFSAKVVLVAVGVSLSGLLIILSFDPMTANDVFTSVGGSPPPNIPLSSWI